MPDVYWIVRADALREDGAISRLWWRCAQHGGADLFEDGTIDLGAPDPSAVSARSPNPDAPDPDGFVRPEWVDRRMLEEWLFAALGRERAAIEARVAGMAQSAPEAAAPPTETLAVIEARLRALEEAVNFTPPTPEAVQPTPEEPVSASPSVTTLPEETTDGGAAPQDTGQTVAPVDEPPPAQVTPPSAPVYGAQQAMPMPPYDYQAQATGGTGRAYAGTMLQEDRENYLRGVITVRVTQIEQNRLQGRYDANARERQRVGFVEFHNASDLGLPITDEVRAAYDEFLAADAWVRATKDHADALRSATITVGLDLLEAMQTSVEENWP